MSKIVYLHAGAPKTGTSALQVALVRNREALFRQGILYPESSDDDRAEKGLITSGNGLLISHLWQRDYNSRLAVKQTAALFRALSRDPKHDILYSSEFFASSPRDNLSKFRDRLAKNGCELKIIYYVRHLLDAAVSLHMRTLRAGHAHDFSNWIATYKHRYRSVLQVFIQAAGRENVVLKLYDDEKRDLVKGFLSSFGNFEFTPLPKGNHGLVNRSFAQDEIDVILQINTLLPQILRRNEAREIAKLVADGVISKLPAQKSRTVVTENEFEKFSENNRPILEYVNRLSPFELKMKSEDIIVGPRGSGDLKNNDLVFLSVVEALLSRIEELQEPIWSRAGLSTAWRNAVSRVFKQDH